MADEGKKPADAGTFSRLAGRGEDALTKMMDELGRNSLLTEALARAMSAKGKVDETTRRTLDQVGLAAAGEIRDLRTRLEDLERRLASIEGGGGAASSRAARRPATSPKASGGTAKKSPTAKPGGTSRSRSSSSSGSRGGSDASKGSASSDSGSAPAGS